MPLLKDAKMDKSVVTITALEQQGDDRAYWSTKTPAERIEALELMRQIMYGYNPITDKIDRTVFEIRDSPKKR